MQTAAETAARIVLADHAPPTGLVHVMPRIAPRPVLLIRGGRGRPDEELNPVYQRAGGRTVQFWEIQQAGHTLGVRSATRRISDRPPELPILDA